MERFENLLDFINELNENGRIPYDDYSRLFDLVQEFAGAEEAINAAATDIAALLWLNGNCEYCEHGEKEEFSGANRWHCRLGNGIDCRPVWRGAATKASLPEIHKAEPTSLRAKPSRAETMFGPKETWAIPDRAEAEETTPKTYKGFLLIRCAAARLLCKTAYLVLSVRNLQRRDAAARPHVGAHPLQVWKALQIPDEFRGGLLHLQLPFLRRAGRSGL